MQRNVYADSGFGHRQRQYQEYDDPVPDPGPAYEPPSTSLAQQQVDEATEDKRRRKLQAGDLQIGRKGPTSFRASKPHVSTGALHVR
jgi:hypothetical protein